MITQTNTTIVPSRLRDDPYDCSPEEKLILSRFAGRARRALIEVRDSLDDGTFWIL